MVRGGIRRLNTRHYETDEQDEVARGPLRVTYRAHDPARGTAVALTVVDVPPDAAAWAEGFWPWVLAETRRVVGLTHPNLVPLHDAFTDGPRLCLVSPLVDGPTLREVQERRRPAGSPPDWRRALPILDGIAAALDHLHAYGIAHLGVTPEGVRLSVDGVRLAAPDLAGIARFPLDVVTRHELALEALQYLPPEWARGEPLGASADRYALALVAYELLTGASPFLDDFVTALLHAMLHESPRPTGDPALDAVMRRALSPRP